MFTPNTKISLDEYVSFLYEIQTPADQDLTYFEQNIVQDLVSVHAEEEYKNYLQDKTNIEAWVMGFSNPIGFQEFKKKLATPFALYVQDRLNQLYIK